MLFIIISTLIANSVEIDAHAYLEESFPAQETEMNESPAEIRLKFTEPINTQLSRVILEDGEGNEIEATQRGEEGLWLILEIPALQPNVYRVIWQVLSIDTHITDGSFRFAVGVDLPRDTPSETIIIDPTEPKDGNNIIDEKDVKVSKDKSRLILYKKLIRVTEMLVVVSIAGLFFFSLFWRNVPDQLLASSIKVEQMLFNTYLSAAILLLITGSLSILNYASQLHLGEWGNPLYWDFVNKVILHTWIGQAALLKPFLFLILYILGKARPKLTLIPAILFIFLLLTFSWTSHANAVNMIFSHIIHLFMASIWLGGLIGFTYVAMKHVEGQNQLTFFHQKLKSFSAIALGSALAVLVTGMLLGIVNLRSIIFLFQSNYGITLGIKIVLVVILLGIAAYHRFSWLPKVEKVSEETKAENKVEINGLIWSLRAELILAWIIIVVASILSSTPLPN